jgi:hypothetical protein
VAWKRVCRPLLYLGILNLEYMNWTLRIRWLWLQKTDSTRAWQGMPVQVPRMAPKLFKMAMFSHGGMDSPLSLGQTDVLRESLSWK